MQALFLHTDPLWPPGFHNVRKVYINYLPTGAWTKLGIRPDSDNILCLMSLPSLQVLYVNGIIRHSAIQDDAPAHDRHTPLGIPSERSSSVQHLHLRNATMKRSDLTALLARPKTLKTLSVSHCIFCHNGDILPLASCLVMHRETLTDYWMQASSPRDLPDLVVPQGRTVSMSTLPDGRHGFIVNLAHLALIIARHEPTTIGYQWPEYIIGFSKQHPKRSYLVAWLRECLPPTAQLLKCVDNQDIPDVTAAEWDAVFNDFINERTEAGSAREVMDLSSLRSPLSWNPTFVRTPQVAREQGITVYMPGEKVDQAHVVEERAGTGEEFDL